MLNFTSLVTSRTWKDSGGKKHKATRVFTPSVPGNVCVVRSSHSPEVCHCGTCQKVVREKLSLREISFVDYVPWEIA